MSEFVFIHTHIYKHTYINTQKTTSLRFHHTVKALCEQSTVSSSGKSPGYKLQLFEARLMENRTT